MPKAMSEDLMARVVAMRREGYSVEEVSAHFKVGRDSVYRWDALEKQHAHATLRQMQAHCEQEVSLMALSRMARTKSAGRIKKALFLSRMRRSRARSLPERAGENP